MDESEGLILLLLLGIGGFYLYIAYGFANLGGPSSGQLTAQGLANLPSNLGTQPVNAPTS